MNVFAPTFHCLCKVGFVGRLADYRTEDRAKIDQKSSIATESL